MSRVAAAITIPATNAAKQVNSRRSSSKIMGVSFAANRSPRRIAISIWQRCAPTRQAYERRDGAWQNALLRAGSPPDSNSNPVGRR
jgi:hypothetical protein